MEAAPVLGGILYLGKSGSSEKSNEKYGCKLMVIRAAAGMRARTRSENLAEAEHANRLVKEILIILKCNLNFWLQFYNKFYRQYFIFCLMDKQT